MRVTVGPISHVYPLVGIQARTNGQGEETAAPVSGELHSAYQEALKNLTGRMDGAREMQLPSTQVSQPVAPSEIVSPNCINLSAQISGALFNNWSPHLTVFSYIFPLHPSPYIADCTIS